jgi:hypothetical protein
MHTDRHHDVLLVLIRDTQELKLAATVRAAIRQRNIDLVIDTIRDPPARLGPVFLTRLTGPAAGPASPRR